MFSFCFVLFFFTFGALYKNTEEDCFCFRGFTLHDALSMLEDDEIEADSITLLPPVNACGNVTDEDSGDEDLIDINNLPASQMQSQVEVNTRITDEDWSSEDELPLSELQRRSKNKSNIKSCGSRLESRTVYRYVKEDLPSDDYVFPVDSLDDFQLNRTPADLFFLFFDNDILSKIVEETNRYSRQKNSNVLVDIAEIKCFFAIL